MGSGSGYISMLENACMHKSKNTNLQSWLNPSCCREKEEQENHRTCLLFRVMFSSTAGMFVLRRASHPLSFFVSGSLQHSVFQ